MKKITRLILAFVLVGAGLTVGEPIIHDAHAGTCSPRGTCRACKNCKYCKHCAKNGGTCSVCRFRVLLPS
jgi:hypothetical protein